MSAGTAHRSVTASGENAATAARTASTSAALTTADAAPSRTRPSSNSVCAIAASRNGSAPGRIGRCSSATLAVSVRRGSMTTSRPPRWRSALARPRKSGTVHMLPLLAIGLAPITSSQSVRSMSGTGTLNQWP